ncbi:hypothetical protein ACH4JZ_18510 [Streptomyces sp. NPDC017615]|uniref:hypothetical protein n=1 Tax=Streptomyces sp. NPDC017615 TaxID=3365003 RepID=UPI00378CBB8E
MSTPSRAQCIADARAVLDRARQRIARDRATGQLQPEAELILRRLERAQRTAPTTGRAAA